MTMKRFAWLLIAAVSAGCGAEQGSGAASGYKVIDSGVGATDHQVYWLDNERVIFQGYEGPKPRNREEGKRLRLGVYIWNVTTGKVERYADSGSGLCYADGYIYYQTKHEIVQERPEMHVRDTWREGPFGREIERVQVWRQDKGKATVIWDDGKGHDLPRSEWNRLTCRAVSRPLSMVGHSWIPLREGDGYLDFGSNSLDKPRYRSIRAVQYDSRGLQLAELPFTRLDVGSVSGRYFVYRGAYFFWQNILGIRNVDGPPYENLNQIWNDTGCLTAYWLRLGGRAEKVCIPSGPWSSESVAVMPYRDGFVIEGAGDQVPATHVVKHGSNAYERLIDGYVSGTSLSPDGCRIAFSHAKDLEAIRVGGRGQRTLKHIELCSQSQGESK